MTACPQTPAMPGHTQQELHWPQSSGGAGPAIRARAGPEAQTSLHAAGSHLAERGGLEGARGGTRGRAELQSCGRHEGGSCGQTHGGDEQGAEGSHPEQEGMEWPRFFRGVSEGGKKNRLRGGARFDTSTSQEACVAMAWRSARLAAFVVAAAAAVCLAGSIVLACGGTAPAVLRQQPSSVSKWMNTLKGAESFLDDAESGRLPARALSDGDQLSSVESMIRKTKEAVHREATRLHSLEAPKQTLPIGAKKIALMTAPGEQNEGFQGLARNDKRPGQVMREVSDLVDQYKAEEDAAAKDLLRTIASKIVESFDNHGLSAAQIAREVTEGAELGAAASDAQERVAGGREAQLRTRRSGEKPTLPIGGLTSDTILGQIGRTEGVQDCTDLPGLPKSSKFCLEGRPYTKLPGIDAAMTSGDMREKIKELKLQAKKNLGIPNAAKVDQEELAKLQDIVKSTKKALSEQEGKLKEIKDSKHTALQDLAAQKRILSMAKDARQQRLAWRSMDAGMSQAYKQAGFKLPLSA